MRTDNENKRIYVRQSWLGDLMICPQRANLALTMPMFRSGSDATAIGTGVHSAIEWALGSHGDHTSINPEEMIEVAQTSVAEELSKPIKLTRISDKPDSIPPSVAAMVTGWMDDIAPQVEWGGRIEHRFNYDTGQVAVNGYAIWMEGTMDYITPSGVIWDWKTASRAYNESEKQKKAHQPTVYCAAAVSNGLATGPEQIFRFGVMVRNQSPKPQVVEVTRNRSHYDFLHRQAKAAVDQAVISSGQRDWFMNDQHVLCSSTWCDYWSICKGSHLP